MTQIQKVVNSETKKRKISFVIPCFRSEHTIDYVLDEIVGTVSSDDDYEIICVNDCSPDNVWDVLVARAKGNENIKALNLAKNFGQHNAIMAGYRAVTGDIIICLDDDGQTPASEFYTLIDAINDDVDAVYASYSDKKHGIIRNLGSNFTSKMCEVMLGADKGMKGSSFFACKRFVIDEIVRYENPYTFLEGLVLRTTHKVSNVEVKHRERLEGVSGYSLSRLISLWLNGFTSFSVKPLRLASMVGAILALLGFVFGCFVALRKILDPSILAGYSSIIAILLFIGGVLMLMLGLLGEYIGRIYISLNRAPQYVIRDSINIDES